MSLEKALADNTAAIVALTAVLTAAAGKGGAAAPAAAATTAAAPGVTAEALKAKFKEVLDKKGKDALAAVLAAFGAKKLSDIPAAKYADAMAAATAKLNEAGEDFLG